MTIITEGDTTWDSILKIADGNQGALSVCMKIFEHGAQIDPDNIMGELGIFMSLDMQEIYGSRVWMFYKDVCNEDLPTMLAINRACQLGFISKDELNHAIDNRGAGINVDALVRQVQERLHAFNTGEATNHIDDLVED